MGRANRRKGIRAELDVCRICNTLIPGVTAKRHLAQWREKSEQDVVGVPGWMIQVKLVKSLSRPAWWAKVDAAAREQGLSPALFVRQPRGSWRVWVRASGELPMAIDIDPEMWAELVVAARAFRPC